MFQEKHRLCLCVLKHRFNKSLVQRNEKPLCPIVVTNLSTDSSTKFKISSKFHRNFAQLNQYVVA